MIVTSYQDLKIPAKPVEDLSPESIERLRSSLREELERHDTGVGLAAPQIGLSVRAMIIRDIGTSEFTLYVNPTITKYAGEQISLTEGCLSFPGMQVRTKRYEQVIVEDALNGAAVFTGIDAAVMQHEIDHLDGVLFFERGVILEPRFDRNDPCFCGSGKKFKKCHG